MKLYINEVAEQVVIAPCTPPAAMGRRSYCWQPLLSLVLATQVSNIILAHYILLSLLNVAGNCLRSASTTL